MKDFKSFSSGGQGGKGTPDGSGQNNGFEDDKGVKLVQRVAQSMAGKSELDIMKAVIAEAERGKREGTLTNQDLDNFYSLMTPSLDGFKRMKLKSIIARLKRL